MKKHQNTGTETRLEGFKQHEEVACDKYRDEATRKIHLKTHIQAIHCEKMECDCQCCDYGSKHHSDLGKHIGTVHKCFRYECQLCSWDFNQMGDMEKHITGHTKEEEGHYCPRCDSWFTTKASLAPHLRSTHWDEGGDEHVQAEFFGLTGNVCGKNFVRKKYFRHHWMMHKD